MKKKYFQKFNFCIIFLQKSATAALQRYCVGGVMVSDPKMWENQVLFNFHYTLNTRWGVQYLQLLNMF